MDQKMLVVIFLLSFACQVQPSFQDDARCYSGGRKYRCLDYEYRSALRSLPVPVCKPSEPMRYPTSHQEVAGIVKEAIRRNVTVKAFGTRLSGTDIICTDGIPIDMTRITGIRINSDDTVTVGAGDLLRTVSAYLARHGKGIKGIPAYGNITIGGLIGTGAHGSSLRLPSTISETVLELLVVDGRGDLRRIKKESDLRAWRVNLGLLGIILEVTLPTVELYKIRAYNQIMSDEILTDGTLLKMLDKTDLMSVYWFPAYHSVVTARSSLVNVSTPGDAWTNDHVPDIDAAGARVQKMLMRIAERRNSTETFNAIQAFSRITLTRKFPGFPPIYTEDSFNVKNPAVGLYYKMLAPVCHETGKTRCAWLHGNDSYTFLIQEFSIGLEKLSEAIQTVRDILRKATAVFPFQGILLRFSRKTTSYMSTSLQGPVCNFEFYVPIRDDYYNQASHGLAAYQAMTQSFFHKYGAQAHWGKTGATFHSTESLAERLNPQARKAFLSKMNEFDPNEIFMNSFGKRLKGTGVRIDSDPKVTRCALLDVCTCARSLDCGRDQKCSRLPGYPNYPVCRFPGTDYPEPVSDLRALRGPSEFIINIFNRLEKIRRTLF